LVLTNEDLLKSIGFIPSDTGTLFPPSASLFTPLPPPDTLGEEEVKEEESSMISLPPEKPESLNLSTERLVETFEMVETPKSVISLSSNDSLHQPPEPTTEGECGRIIVGGSWNAFVNEV